MPPPSFRRRRAAASPGSGGSRATDAAPPPSSSRRPVRRGRSVRFHPSSDEARSSAPSPEKRSRNRFVIVSRNDAEMPPGGNAGWHLLLSAGGGGPGGAAGVDQGSLIRLRCRGARAGGAGRAVGINVRALVEQVPSIRVDSGALFLPEPLDPAPDLSPKASAAPFMMGDSSRRQGRGAHREHPNQDEPGRLSPHAFSQHGSSP